MLAMLKPQLKAALEGVIRSAPPAAAAADLAPVLEGLIAPELHAGAADLLFELAGRIGARARARQSLEGGR